MSLENHWYEPDKVFITLMSGVITYEDLVALAELWLPLVAKYEGQVVHNLTDVDAVERYDIRLQDLRNAFSRFEKNKLAGWVVLTGDMNPAFRFLISFSSQLMGFKFRLLPNLEAGLVFLNEQDDSLPPLLPIREGWSAEDRDR